jgi:hypothetical protein
LPIPAAEETSPQATTDLGFDVQIGKRALGYCTPVIAIGTNFVPQSFQPGNLPLKAVGCGCTDAKSGHFDLG